MGIKQLYNDNLRKLPNEYGDVSVMGVIMHGNFINKTIIYESILGKGASLYLT